MTFSLDVVAWAIVNEVKPEGSSEEARLSCECGGIEAKADGSEPFSFDEVRTVLDHALHDHATRYGVLISRTTTLLNGYQLALNAGAPALTEFEEKWRKSAQK